MKQKPESEHDSKTPPERPSQTEPLEVPTPIDESTLVSKVPITDDFSTLVSVDPPTTDESTLVSVGETNGPENTVRLPGSFRGNERFEILHRLGSGGMGVVYEAVDHLRNERVAMKTMNRADSKLLLRFKREFRSLADVQHPNLVQLYELFANENEPWFFTMELIRGVTLLDYVNAASDRQERIKRLRESVSSLADGLLALHAARKLHRDVKPQNAIVETTGRVVLVDFGLAVETDADGIQRQTEGGGVGTLAYMAPEQIAGGSVPASDWYSVGAIIYQALTGRLPFEGSMLSVIEAKKTKSPLPAASLAGDAPAELCDLCDRLLLLDASARPSGEEIRETLTSDSARIAVPQSDFHAATRDLFVGRELALQQLQTCWDEFYEGDGTTVVSIEGVSGLGKTALAEQFLSRLHANVMVLRSRCFKQESVPYKAFDGAVDELLLTLNKLSNEQLEAVLPRSFDCLVRLFPVLNQIEERRPVKKMSDSRDAQELRCRAFAAFRNLCSRLGDRWPIIIYIEDAHWSDEDSASLFSSLLLPPQPPHIFFMVCGRGGVDDNPLLKAVDADLIDKQTDVCIERMEMAPFTPQETAKYLQQAIGENASRYADLITKEALGNPYFVSELAERIRHDSNDSSDLPLSLVSLQDLIDERISELDGPTCRLLQTIALSGKPIEERLLLTVLDDNQRKQLSELLAKRLIRSSSSENRSWSCYHDRIRETAANQLAPAAREELHRSLALALGEQEIVDSESIAFHFRAARDNVQALTWTLKAAGHAAQSLAFDRAAALYKGVVDLASVVEPAAIKQDQIEAAKVSLAEALANAGRGAAAAEAFLVAAKTALPQQAIELKRRAATQFLNCGHVKTGLTTLREVLNLVGLPAPATPMRALLGVLKSTTKLWFRGTSYRVKDVSQIDSDELLRVDACWSGAIGLSVIDTIQGVYYLNKNVLLALECGEPMRIARALTWQAANSSSVGTHGRSDRPHRFRSAAAAALREVESGELYALDELVQSIIAFCRGQWKPCHEHSIATQDRIREQCLLATWERTTAQSFEVWSACYLGDVCHLQQRLPEMCARAKACGDKYALVNHLSFAQFFVEAALDRPDSAKRVIEEACELWDADGFHIQHANVIGAIARVSLYQGQYRDAADGFKRCYDGLKTSFLSRLQVMRIFTDVYLGICHLSLCAVGNASQRRSNSRIVKRIVRGLHRERAAWATAYAEMLEGGLHSLAGNLDRGIASYQSAMAGFENCDMVLNAAATGRRIGVLLGGARGKDLIDAAEDALRAQQVVNPERMSIMLIGDHRF